MHFAQKFNWNEAKKVKNGLYQYPVGEDGGITYKLGADVPLFGYNGASTREIGHFYILKYSNGAEEPEEVKVKTENTLYSIEACYMSDKKIVVLYKTFKGGYSVDYYGDIFDENGVRLRTVALIDKKTNSDKKMMDRYMDIYTSENNNSVLLRFGSIFKMFDKDLNKQWERDFPKYYNHINVTNDGSLIMISHEKDNDKSYSVVWVSPKNKVVDTKMATEGDIYYDQKNDLLYVLSYSGAADKGHFLHYGSHTDLKISKSFSYAVYQGADMKKLDESNSIVFKDRIIKEAMDKDEVDGLVGLQLKSVISNNNENSVFVFNTQANVFSGELAMPECVVFVKVKGQSETVQKLITKVSVEKKVRYMMSEYNVLYNGKDICLLYYTDENNREAGASTLNICAFNPDLESLGNQELIPKKEHGYNVDLEHFYKQSDHKYQFYGLASNTKIGIADLTF